MEFIKERKESGNKDSTPAEISGPFFEASCYLMQSFGQNPKQQL